VENQPIQEIKPVVIPAQFFVLGPLASGLIALIPGLVVGTVVLMSTKIPDPVEPGYMPDTYQWGLAFSSALAASGLIFVVSMVLIGISAFKGPGRTTYTIFPDRVECCEGVWVKTRRNVAFDRVTSVEATEGILQQTRGAGTVILFAREEGNLEDQQVPASGVTKRIELANVAHPKEVYELIRTLVLQKNWPNKPLQM
jgi:hypothetical protein